MAFRYLQYPIFVLNDKRYVLLIEPDCHLVVFKFNIFGVADRILMSNQ
jgi:hypothetical protein